MKNIKIAKTQKAVEVAASELSKLTHIAIDTETNGLDPHTCDVLLLQMGNEDVQYVFDIHYVKNYLNPVLDVLQNKDIVKVAHNAKFDYKMIRASFGIRVSSIACTLMMEQLLTKGFLQRGFALGNLIEKYNLGYMDKEQQSSFIDQPLGTKFNAEQYEYAAKDVELLLQMFNKQSDLCYKRNMAELAALENKCIAPLSDMEYNGIYIDQSKWLALESLAKANADKAKIKLDRHVLPYCEADENGAPIINYSSPKQVKPMLEKLTKKTLESTSEKYLKMFHHEAIECLLEYRGALKQVSTYGAEFLKDVNSKTNRIHANYLQLGTDSGRMSCRQPNIQNIPHQQEYRTPFCAQRPNYKIICADFASQELRVLAQLSKEQVFVEAIKDGKDLHCLSASLVFDMDYNSFFDTSGKVKPDMKDFRTKSKTITFGIVYGMGAWALAKSLEIDKNEAQKLLNKYFKVFPSIKGFLDRMEREAYYNKFAFSPLDGRRRDLTTIDWDHWRKRKHALNIAKNHPIQGASATITKKAIINIDNYIREHKKDAGIIAVIHDEVLVECHENIADEMATVVEQGMIKAFNYYCPDVPMEVDAVIGNHWIH